jgi:hypothetical protein
MVNIRTKNLKKRKRKNRHWAQSHTPVVSAIDEVEAGGIENVIDIFL